ncbi:hypothetical protein [Geopsychrobacter electrodiphilus]|uniref:hypothetical protein n=1 Tax=Geopsychrobacter electrodiphilus TaxID=225196 RepID=UPI000364E59E|nr:hypothetical protein [Geopsychrobacter electrodiphilus]
MFNNLIARAIIPITIAVTGFVVFGCILLYTFIKTDMINEALGHVDSLAETVAKSTSYAMLKDERESLANIVRNVGTLSEVRQILIYDEAGMVHFSGADKITETRALAGDIEAWSKQIMRPDYARRTKTQHNVENNDGLIAVSIPILNEAHCSTASCHFHAPDEPVLGFLNISISRGALEKTLALLKSRMIIFSLMVLFLTIGGVAALLQMNLFLPIRRLTWCAELAASGVQDKDLPESDGKLGRLNEDFRRLIQQRDQARQDQKATCLSTSKADHDSDTNSRIKNRDTRYQSSAATGSSENPKT